MRRYEHKVSGSVVFTKGQDARKGSEKGIATKLQEKKHPKEKLLYLLVKVVLCIAVACVSLQQYTMAGATYGALLTTYTSGFRPTICVCVAHSAFIDQGTHQPRTRKHHLSRIRAGHNASQFRSCMKRTMRICIRMESVT
jgi:hypothetical protein